MHAPPLIFSFHPAKTGKSDWIKPDQTKKAANPAKGNVQQRALDFSPGEFGAGTASRNERCTRQESRFPPYFISSASLGLMASAQIW
ncbi:MAG: hypothetical protein JWO08_2377 [Verrucomicrobiaceae bacterium]|nr:hypothetical protein [Verrucomicrobiaceae bacterium]